MDHDHFAADGGMAPQLSVATEGGSGTPVPDLSSGGRPAATLGRMRAAGFGIENGPVAEPGASTASMSAIPPGAWQQPGASAARLTRRPAGHAAGAALAGTSPGRQRWPGMPQPARDTSIVTYRAKRDFAATPEPRPAAGPPARRSRFVVQKHDARRLHWDFRLEHDGVLLSWAVPKGPSLDPADKRLAVRVEDHPIDYAEFHGTIPEGNYGAGTVEIWDAGSWAPLGDPAADLAAGELKFRVDGARLSGGFVLVRMKPRGRERAENWLLIKEHDEAEQPGGDAAALEAKPPPRRGRCRRGPSRRRSGRPRPPPRRSPGRGRWWRPSPRPRRGRSPPMPPPPAPSRAPCRRARSRCWRRWSRNRPRATAGSRR